jgi:hypothetical protein
MAHCRFIDFDITIHGQQAPYLVHAAYRQHTAAGHFAADAAQPGLAQTISKRWREDVAPPVTLSWRPSARGSTHLSFMAMCAISGNAHMPILTANPLASASA